MTLHFFFMSLCLTLAQPASAAQNLFQELAQNVKKSNAGDQLNGQFKQIKHFQELDMDVVTEGKFRIRGFRSSDRELEWSVLRPEASKICMNKDRIVLYGKQKQVLNLKEIDSKSYNQILLLIQLLVLDADFMQTKFTLQKDKGEYLMTPKEEKDFIFHKIAFTLNQKNQVEKVQLFEKNQDQIKIQFFAQQSEKQSQTFECLK